MIGIKSGHILIRKLFVSAKNKGEGNEGRGLTGNRARRSGVWAGEYEWRPVYYFWGWVADCECEGGDCGGYW